ncbi:DUF881 domain-containing protein [Rhizomonospora bruguierae]|uniref:DUF881 domain-containing protein n=1 Tax=Rhizomonospora bruguierae TaxID=1581705 RepID=UPI001BCB2F33|nr:DUF881 domain-containing protein [Micromonospora sp. NBRC 107566]
MSGPKEEFDPNSDPAAPSEYGGTRGGRYPADFLTELFRTPLDPSYAAAARQRERLGPPGPRERLTGRGLTAIVLVLVGFLLAVAYRHALADEPNRARARAGLVGQINEMQRDTDTLQIHADQLREEVARQRAAALSGTEAAELRDLEAATGLARVSGRGVVVRVANAPSSQDAITGKSGNDPGRVLDRDLQQIANALFAGGAEAVAVNGQRLTATSTIRAAGGTILVDFRPVTSPYEVSAIGPDDLADYFRASSVAHLLKALADAHGMGYQVRGVGKVTLPGATEPQLRNATPLHPGVTSSGPAASSPAPTGSPSAAPTEGGR